MDFLELFKGFGFMIYSIILFGVILTILFIFIFKVKAEKNKSQIESLKE